jgi:hypothetical protein
MDEVWDFDGLDIADGGPITVPPHASASAPSGESEILFGTPSSTASGSTGGGGKAGAKLGLVFVGDLLDVCGGMISGAGHTEVLLDFVSNRPGRVISKDIALRS